MLRDGLSSLDWQDGEHLFMNTAGVTIDSPQGQTDALDDIFGSAPGSPIAAPEDYNDSHEPHNIAPRDHSDIPRLRSLHVTNGYREGIAASKEHHIQEGFDEGYSLGAEIGMKAGWCIGALQGMNGVIEGDVRRELAVLLSSAEEELNVKSLFSADYFGSDGIWLYDVPGQDAAEEQVTFEQVAAHHPVLLKWIQQVSKSAESLGLKLEPTSGDPQTHQAPVA